MWQEPVRWAKTHFLAITYIPLCLAWTSLNSTYVIYKFESIIQILSTYCIITSTLRSILKTLTALVCRCFNIALLSSPVSLAWTVCNHLIRKREKHTSFTPPIALGYFGGYKLFLPLSLSSLLPPKSVKKLHTFRCVVCFKSEIVQAIGNLWCQDPIHLHNFTDLATLWSRCPCSVELAGIWIWSSNKHLFVPTHYTRFNILHEVRFECLDLRLWGYTYRSQMSALVSQGRFGVI